MDALARLPVAPKMPPVDQAHTLRVHTGAGTPISQIIRPNGTFLEIGDWAKLHIMGLEQLVVTEGKAA